jgi:tetratricopeptide (TPR) repeat protein
VEYWRARTELRCPDTARRASGRARLARIGMRDPPDPVAAFEAGQAALRAGQASEAVTLLSRAAPSGYQAVLTHELLAEAYAAQGRASAAAWARGRAQRFRGQLGAAEASLRRSLALNPSPPGVSIELAQVLSLAGQPRAALAALQSARRAHPADLDLALAEADALNALDRFDEQARTLEAAASLTPQRAAEPLRNLGKMYFETRQFDRVIPALERAVKQEPEDAVSHRYMGLCYAMRREDPAQAQQAVEHLLRAAAITPDDSAAWTSAGTVLQRLGDVSEAVACYRRAIDGNSAADGPYVSLAQSLQRQGQPAEAALLLRLYRERRERQARRAGWERRINADRRDAVAHYAMGDLLLRTDGAKAAYPYLLIAASLRPQWREAQERLADACALLDYVDLWQEAERAARGKETERPR